MSLVSIDGKLLIKTINNKPHLVTGGNSCCCEQRCDIIDIRYVWECNPSEDLDTSTIFLGNSVGWSCGSNNQYIIWDGDNTGASGAEHITVNIRKALEDGLWNDSVDIELKAGWYAPADGSGKAQILVKLIKGDGTICKETCCQTDDLPSQNNCASNSVGAISVTENNGVLDFSLSPCTTCSDDCSTTTTTTSTTPPPEQRWAVTDVVLSSEYATITRTIIEEVSETDCIAPNCPVEEITACEIVADPEKSIPCSSNGACSEVKLHKTISTVYFWKKTAQTEQIIEYFDVGSCVQPPPK